MAIPFDPRTFENTSLNHYIIFEGAVPPKLSEAIQEWLGQFKAIQMTETMWCYRVPASGKTVEERRKSLNQVLETMPTGGDLEPYRIIFLSPFGQGALTYKMPQINMPGNISVQFGRKDSADDIK